MLSPKLLRRLMPHLEVIFRFAARLVVSGRGADDMSRFVGSLYDVLCHFEPGLEEIFVQFVQYSGVLIAGGGRPHR